MTKERILACYHASWMVLHSVLPGFLWAVTDHLGLRLLTVLWVVLVIWLAKRALERLDPPVETMASTERYGLPTWMANLMDLMSRWMGIVFLPIWIVILVQPELPPMLKAIVTVLAIGFCGVSISLHLWHRRDRSSRGSR